MSGSAEKRERILAAAKKLIFHYGFRKTAMADIAREAGLSVGTLYNFFKNKEDICSACAELFKLTVIAEMRKVASSKLSPEKKLVKLMLTRNLAYHHHLKDTPHALEIVTVLLPKNKELMKRFEEMDIVLIEEVLVQGVTAGIFKEGSKKGVARVFLNAFSRYSPPMSIGLGEADIRKGTVEMAKLLLKALEAGRSDKDKDKDNDNGNAGADRRPGKG